MKNIIKKILKEDTESKTKELIKITIDDLILPEYKDIVCGIEVKSPSEIEVIKGQPKFTQYKITITFIGGYGTKYFPITQRIREKYEEVMDKIWEIIYDYTSTPVSIYHNTTKTCD